jgi:Uma2 family endonuclease
MSAGTLISVEEYLRTSYHPDCDYVNGEVVERNVGEKSHNKLQKALLLYLSALEKRLGIWVIQEQRVQVNAVRYRVPDLCVTLREPAEEIVTEAPLLCIEILSPEDRMSRMQERVDDYIAMGVPNVWVLDPAKKRAWSITAAEGWREEKSGALKTGEPAIEVMLSEIFG